MSAEAAQAGIAARMQGLRNRYAGWQSARATGDSEDVPAPPAAQLPPLPDAPDGEITRQREEAGQ